MPNLSWLGKDKVVTYHQKVPYHFLDKKFSVGNSENAIIHGDNLIALKSLLPRYENKIKCIYIDPPYNTGNENWIYNDNVSDSRLQKWLGQVVGKEGEDLTRHDKWLCMMYPRLRLLQKLLADDGAIFISIDDNEVANLKLICDEIFGAWNFIETYFWESTFRPDNSSPIIRRNAEYIFCYAKKKENIKYFKGVKSKSEGMPSLTKAKEKWKQIKFPTNVVKTFLPDGIYQKGLKDNGKNLQWELVNDVEVKDGVIITEVILNGHSYWATQEKIISELQQGTEIWIKSESFVPYYKKAKESVSRPTKLLDRDITNDYLYANTEIEKIFGKKIFNNPKPTTLVSFLCDFLDDKNAIILDAFAGSGTTAHAVINLNKQDGGNRKFILIELNDYAESITAERVKRVGGEFNFYEIGESLFDEDDFINDAVPFERICEYIYFAETGKTFVPCEEKNLLGVDDDTAYYYFGGENLSWTTLSKIKTRAKVYVIYADACNLSEDEMMKYQIHFRQIPFDVRRY